MTHKSIKLKKKSKPENEPDNNQQILQLLSMKTDILGNNIDRVLDAGKFEYLHMQLKFILERLDSYYTINNNILNDINNKLSLISMNLNNSSNNSSNNSYYDYSNYIKNKYTPEQLKVQLEIDRIKSQVKDMIHINL